MGHAERRRYQTVLIRGIKDFNAQFDRLTWDDRVGIDANLRLGIDWIAGTVDGHGWSEDLAEPS